MNCSDELKYQYEELLGLIGMDDSGQDKRVLLIIKNALVEFQKYHKIVALYCYGKHTKMLMSDYVFELKNVKYIIDNNVNENDSGYRIIKEGEIEENNIDGIIISSFKYMEEIKKMLQEKHPHISILDIYEVLRREGIELTGGYYDNGPYVKYLRINDIKNQIIGADPIRTKTLRMRLLKEFILIKEFRLALECAVDIYEDGNEIIKRIRRIYDSELDAASKIDDNNVLLLCLDGLRAKDVCKEKMSKITRLFENRTLYFKNAYAYSTSTFESLVPSFSENSNQHTYYYKKSSVSVDDCRFMRKAIQQKRDIFIYGDQYHYIDSDLIHYADHSQTVSEKIWDFIVDASARGNGLFYLHELYESHFSYPNPYTVGKLIADGTALLFDYMPNKGGKPRTDYVGQHEDSIRYLDDTLYPILERLKCGFVFFADHGNMIMRQTERLDNIKAIDLTASEDWIRIPFAVMVPGNKAKISQELFSLTQINDVIVSLLDREEYRTEHRKYIKIGRSSIYNPDFKWIYAKCGLERYLNAFEGFIFDDGYKLLIFSDGHKELFYDDEYIDDENIVMKKMNDIEDLITVL